jgi:dihydroxy-acid dehydratase
MQDLHEHGGIPAVMKYLLKKGLLHGDCLTVTGKTLAENLEAIPDLDFEKQKIIMPVEKPLKATGHLQVLYGNLAEGGSVAKISGKEGERFEGPARVFNGEFELIDGINSKKIKPGDVVVIRHVGPKGAPGMPEMLKTHLRTHWCRAWQFHSAYYRWKIQWRYARVCCRPYYAGSL